MIYNNANYLQKYPLYSQERLRWKIIAGILCRREKIRKVHFFMEGFEFERIEEEFPLADPGAIKYIMELDFLPSTERGLLELPLVGKHISALVRAMYDPTIYPIDRHVEKILPDPRGISPKLRAWTSAYIAYYKEIPPALTLRDRSKFY